MEKFIPSTKDRRILFRMLFRQYIQYCKDQNYTARYIGSLVADFHRNMLKGGIYIYPATSKDPNGKLRLMYECNALAFIAEQAGGSATDGKRRILDIELKDLHQRTAFFVGSKNMVEKAQSFQVIPVVRTILFFLLPSIRIFPSTSSGAYFKIASYHRTNFLISDT